MKPTTKSVLIFMLLFVVLTSAFSQNYLKHKVKEGESLDTIAKFYKLSKLEILKVNSNFGSTLPVGYELTIPIEKPKEIAPQPKPVNKPKPQPKPKTVPKPKAPVKKAAVKKTLVENNSNMQKVHAEIASLKSNLELLLEQNTKLAEINNALLVKTESLNSSVTQQSKDIENLSAELEKAKAPEPPAPEEVSDESGPKYSLSFGSSLYNRYVWRGADYGNSPAVQPYMSCSIGSFEIGAWSSWSLPGEGGVNENDLYAIYSFSNFSVTVTDFFYPGYKGNDKIDDYSDDGAHLIELSGAVSFSKFNILLGSMVAGNDSENSKYVELGYSFYEKESVSASFFAGAGNGFYTLDTEFDLMNIGISLSKDNYSASYVVNPDQKTSFFVFGISL